MGWMNHKDTNNLVLVTLSPCRTLQNVIQTQKCEQCQPKELSTPFPTRALHKTQLPPHAKSWVWLIRGWTAAYQHWVDHQPLSALPLRRIISNTSNHQSNNPLILSNNPSKQDPRSKIPESRSKNQFIKIKNVKIEEIYLVWCNFGVPRCNDGVQEYNDGVQWWGVRVQWWGVMVQCWGVMVQCWGARVQWWGARVLWWGARMQFWDAMVQWLGVRVQWWGVRVQWWGVTVLGCLYSVTVFYTRISRNICGKYLQER